MKEMARMELSENEELQPKLEEEIKLLLVPKDPEDDKNVQNGNQSRSRRRRSCIVRWRYFQYVQNDTATRKAGHYL